MYEGWLTYAGAELVNNERASAYADAMGIAGVGCASCADDALSTALGDKPYTTPEQDDAPWYDPRFPASGRFAGFLGMAVDGFGGTGTRSPIDLREGALIGPLRRAQREIAVTALAVAADEEALSYGLAWLASALRGGVCPSCRGDNACLFAACPTGDGRGQQRTMVDVGLLEGPTTSEKARLGATCEGTQPGVIATVEYTLVAGTPHLYHEPTMLRVPRLLSMNGIADPPAACTVPTCTPDPNCPAAPARPAAPAPTNPCECVWPGTGATVKASVVELAPENVGRWTETVPVVVIYTGNAAMKCLRVRFWRNPRGEDFPGIGQGNPCDFCDEFGVTYLPPYATLIVDGRSRTVTLNCGDGPVPQGPYLYASPGRSFSWPVLDCPGGIWVEFLAVSAAANTRIDLGLCEREDAC